MPTTASPPRADSEPPTMLAHHFDDLEQQHSASRLAMWVFLATEVMFFGGLFAAYAVYRSLMADAFAAGSRRLDIVLGTVNTAVLLCSSLTMALAVDSAHRVRPRAQIGFLVATVLLGCVFLVIKSVEYQHKLSEGLLPMLGWPFRVDGALSSGEQVFFGLYLAMTGCHALHMLVGIALLLWLVTGTVRGRFRGADSHAVELSGLYWHFIDIVWVFLFPLLYLIDRS